MYSGFISSRKTVAAIGVHQRFDMAAYRVASPYFADGTFPTLRQILHFEGINGPDGLKVKSPGKHEPSHLYNPVTDVGPIPDHIKGHYTQLVAALKNGDNVRAAFEASWMAHYICDGLTPAHHFPLEDKIAEHSSKEPNPGSSFFKHKVVGKGDTPADAVRRGWAIWGGKGLLTTHFNFEMGVATALLAQKIKVQLDPVKLAHARQVGAITFFKEESRDIAKLEMYDKFYNHGWNGELARLVKNRLAPQTAQTIAIIWLLAYLEAGLDAAKIDAVTPGKAKAKK
ncbi:MAG TPA: hypothetical protein VLF21_03095 [Candidatus Saccharimonadales bacterium]|nr:hypothetical protein [Candidatus Saccharimonadales bacterium]